MRRSAEAEQSNPLAMLNSCHSQRAKANNPGAQERRRVQVVEGGREGKHEISARHRVLGITAVHGVSGESR